MPVILDRSDIETWLHARWEEAKSLTEVPFEADRMESFAVSNDVGKVANNYPDLLSPLTERRT